MSAAGVPRARLHSGGVLRTEPASGAAPPSSRTPRKTCHRECLGRWTSGVFGAADELPRTRTPQAAVVAARRVRATGKKTSPRDVWAGRRPRVGVRAHRGGQGLRTPPRLPPACAVLGSPPAPARAAPRGPGHTVPEVVGALPLPEAAAGHDADAGLLQQAHAVEHVGGHVTGLREQAELRVRSGSAQTRC